MKMVKLCIVISSILIYNNSHAQQTAPPESKTLTHKSANTVGVSSKLGFNAALGMASYLGDLIQGNKLFSQPGVSFALGLTYPVFPKFNGRFDIGFSQVGAKDSKNSSSELKARNLSFKSNVVDVSVSLEYEFVDLKTHKFSPYVSAGVGVMFFNPHAKSASGQKTFLRDLGTEGQGLNGFAAMYKKSAVESPIGVGLKYAVNSKIMIQLEFNYRVTGTDHLDDVSLNYYPDKALLDARNPATAAFTYRGNEVGAGPYPGKNNQLSRGNPSNNDGFYSTQFKVAFKR